MQLLRQVHKIIEMWSKISQKKEKFPIKIFLEKKIFQSKFSQKKFPDEFFFSEKISQLKFPQKKEKFPCRNFPKKKIQTKFF